MKSLLKDKDKPKKERSHPQGWWQKVCDRMMQDIQRKRIPNCEVCGKKNEVGHHYHTKSMSSYLRYDWRNLIPLCHGCHFKHHKMSDPAIHNTVNYKRGQDWVTSLEGDRRKPADMTVYRLKRLYAEYKKILDGDK